MSRPTPIKPSERRGFEAAAVRTAPMNTMLAPTLRFKNSNTSGFVGELLLEVEEAHAYRRGNLLGSVKYIGAF